MKLIIAGSRTLNVLPTFFSDVWDNLSFGDITEVVSGTAHGIDRDGEYFAENYEIPVKKFPADWDKYGRGAGPMRNRQMAEYADALLLVWDGVSSGSKNMKEEMQKLNKPIYEVVIRRVL